MKSTKICIIHGFRIYFITVKIFGAARANKQNKNKKELCTVENQNKT